MTDELKLLNDEVSELLFDLLEVAAVDQWEEECLLLDTLLATSVEDDRSLQSHRAQLNAMLTLKWELQREDQHDEEEVARMKSLMDAMRAAPGLKVALLPPWFLPEYELDYEPQPFAGGTFGSVHRCVWSSGVKAVAKRLHVDGMAIDRRTARLIEKEVDSHFQMNHSNVVKMFGASHVSSPQFLVYEDAVNGDLGSFLSSSEQNKQRMWESLYQAALGLDYLHNKGVVHGHLKLSNILVGADGQAKLSDFGLTTTRLVSTKGGGSSSDLRWRAPECLSRRPTFASDVYSLAMCMIEAATGELPFAYLTDHDMRDNLKSGTIPDQPDEMNDRVWALVLSMTAAEPVERVGLSQVIHTLETLSRSELPSTLPAGSSHCSVCLSLIMDLSRCCAQCGNGAFVKEEQSPTRDSPVNFSPASISTEMNGDTSVSELLCVIRQGDADEQEDAVLLLLQACIQDFKRRQLYADNGLPDLVYLVKHGRSYLVSVCAFGCLGWCTELDAALPEDELVALQASIRPATTQECAAIVENIRHGGAHDKLKAVIYCACVAEANGSGVLHAAGVVAPLVQLLTCANDSLLSWTMNAIGNMADCEETKTLMAREGAVTLLVAILQTAEDEHQALAAYALGRLASGQDEINAAIAESGAIAHLVKLLRADTEMHKNYAAFALKALAVDNHEDNCVAIADEGAIPLLANLLRTSVGEGRSLAASALGWLASNRKNCSTIAKEGVIPDLVAMVESGSDDEKEHAIGASFFLSSKAGNSELMIEGGAIPALVQSLSNGDYIEHAVVALEDLASHHTRNGKAIVDAGAIDPLKKLLRSGNEVEKGAAAHTLGLVSAVSRETRLSIADAEVMELLVNLLQTTTGEQKDKAMSALCFLTDEGNGDLSSIKKESIVPEMVHFLRQKEPQHQKFAATVLGRFATSANFRTLIANEGAISPLVELLRVGNAANKEKAATALGHLANGNPINSREIKRLGVELLLAKLRRTGTHKQKRSAAKALGFLSEEEVASKRGRR